MTAVTLTGVIVALLCVNLLAQTVSSRVVPNGIIDLANSSGWKSVVEADSRLMVHQVPGGWMVRTPTQDPELAMFMPDPAHDWESSSFAWQKSSMGGLPVLRHAVPDGWLIQRITVASQPAGEPFFVPDAEHDSVFDPRTALIFAVNGLDFESVN